MRKSEIKTHGGVPTLFVDGKPVIENAYIIYFTDKECYGEFAEHGCRLFSVPIFFAEKTVNEISQFPPFLEGIFENKDYPNFSVADREIERIIAACPDAMIFPRINMALPLWWERENPDELCDTGYTENRRPCFSSDKWAEDTKRFLSDFIDHVQSSKYAENIIGYQLADGNTEEWFSFDQKGSIGIRSREKFAEYCTREGLRGTEEEYYAFLSRMTADRICEFAAFAKEKVEHQQVIGSFYGYTLECPKRSSCHHALGHILECPDIDFLCSPASYMDDRKSGNDNPCMLPVDSLKLHGKLYFTEDDTRTHLTTPPNDQPMYNKLEWQAHDKRDTLELLKLQYSRALTHGHALWWFDMFGGWYSDDDYRALFKNFWKLWGEALGKSLASKAEIALFVDESAYAYLSETPENIAIGKTAYRIRVQMGKIGAPYDCYLLSDYERVKNRYKAHIVLKLHSSPLSDALFGKSAPKCVKFITYDDINIATEELRNFAAKCGVFLYADKDAVIFANESYLFLHTCEEGKYPISLPADTSIKTLIGEYNNGILPAGTSYLFEFERKLSK